MQNIYKVKGKQIAFPQNAFIVSSTLPTVGRRRSPPYPYGDLATRSVSKSWHRQETRLINAVQQPIYVYACHEPAVAAGLTKAIEEFFAHLSPGAALRQAGAFSKKAVVTA